MQQRRSCGVGRGEVVMTEVRRGEESLIKAQSREGWQVRGGGVSAFLLLLFSFTLVVKRERTSSHCGGVALKVVPLAHAATFTHGCTLAFPGGAVT